jgi:ureidoacrylate peracid hydrolase
MARCVVTAVPFRYDPAHSALVLIDVQNDFCDPEGALGVAGNDTADAVAMVPRLQPLIEVARAGGVPVIFVRTEHDETNDTPQWLGRRSPEPGAAPPGRTCRTGTWGAQFYHVAPAAGETVVTKNRYSAFAGTNLDIVLRARGISSLLFTGVATEVCVESSLRDAVFAEYYVSLVEDCAATYDEEMHRASVRVVDKHFGTVVDSAYLTSLWTPANRTAEVAAGRLGA